MTFPRSMMLFAGLLPLASSAAVTHDLCEGAACPSIEMADDVDFMQKKLQMVAQSQQAEIMLASDIGQKPDGKKDKSWINQIKNLETTETPTCLQELEVRQEFSLPHDPLEHGSEMLRLVFHDALDFNNLHDENGEELKEEDGWKKPYGGVDGCLFAGARRGDDGKYHQDPGHNNGLRDSIIVSTKAQNVFTNISKADLKVAASLAALEEDARGPHVPMKWGRRVPEDCQDRAGKYENNLETNAGGTQWIHTGPDLNSFDHQTLLDVFLKIGLSQQDMVALMGAHTYGDVSVCSKVLNRVEVGNFCDKAKRPKHWEVVGGKTKIRPVGAPDQKGREITQSGTKGKWKTRSQQFDDGAVWDQTPACFDNRYYQTFANAKFEWKDGCCGRVGQRSRNKGGKPNLKWKRKNRWDKANAAADPYCLAGRGRNDDTRDTYSTDGNQRNNGNICDETHPWCFSNWPYDGEERRDKSTMRNVYDYGFQDYQVPVVNDSYGYPMEAGWMKPVFRSPTEWSMLADATSRQLLHKYAASEKDFFDDFASAYTKVLELTPQKDELATCRPDTCTYVAGASPAFVCNGKSFPVDHVDCQVSGPAPSSCQIVQVIGTRAVIECDDGTPRLCCPDTACTKTIRAWQHKQKVTLGTCFDDGATEPNTGDTAVNRDRSFA